MGAESLNKTAGEARSTRFPADPNAVASLTLTFSRNSAETFVGLVKNESKTGCCLILVTARKIAETTEGICQVGKLPYTKVKVTWTKKISPRVVELGLRYLP